MDMQPVDLPPALEPYREKIEQSMMPFIRIKAEIKENPDIIQSKFGGFPYLPQDFEYPADQQGKPMVLLAQIDCASLPPIALFPPMGMLQFYVADEDMYGLDLDQPTRQSNFKILYFSDIDTQNFRTDFDFLPDFENMPVTQTYTLQFEEARAPVGLEDIRFDSVFEDSSYTFFKNLGTYGQEIKKAYAHSFSAGGHKMGGYAHFTQEDPRWVHAEFADAILLLQIDSDDNGIRWGDQGIAHFFILAEDLEKRDFSRVMFNWDAP